MRGRLRPVVAVAGTAAALGILGVAVFPTRTLLAQRNDIAAAEAELRDLDAQNDDLQARVDALGTDEEIERIAREQYRLVFPGEEAYAMLPPPPLPIPVPDAWPFRGLHAAVEAQSTPAADPTDG